VVSYFGKGITLSIRGYVDNANRIFSPGSCRDFAKFIFLTKVHSPYETFIPLWIIFTILVEFRSWTDCTGGLRMCQEHQ